MHVKILYIVPYVHIAYHHAFCYVAGPETENFQCALYMSSECPSAIRLSKVNEKLYNREISWHFDMFSEMKIEKI